VDTPEHIPAPTHELSTSGVGPWVGEWPTGDEYDSELLRDGDTRNVIDRYRYWRMEAIVADLDARRHGFHVAIENWQHDMNIGSIVRSANAFGAAAVHIVGRKRWNKRGAMVTDRYQHVMHHETVADLGAWAVENSIPVLAIDNVPGCVPIETFVWPEKCLMLFGQEGPGLSAEAIALATNVIEITQFGSTRSINASAAAAVTMHSWVLQHAVVD
jgi:tRNA G18 (ribose-2'-O)-methylase SpoU